MNSQSKRRIGWKSKIVEPYMQVKMGVMFLGINLLFAILILLIYGYFMRDVYEALSFYFQLNQSQDVDVMKKFTIPLVAGIVVIVTFIISTLYLSIHYTHQIYGPLVSINRFIDSLLAKEIPSPLQLRESDQLQELAIKLNEIAKRISVHEIDRQALLDLELELDSILKKQQPTHKSRVLENDHYRGLLEKVNLLYKKVSS